MKIRYYVLPKHLDEKVARLHLEKVGAKLTKLSKEQADYISVTTEGPYKPDAYALLDSRINISEEIKTKSIAEIFSNNIKVGDTMFFNGELGVGKTTFTGI